MEKRRLALAWSAPRVWFACAAMAALGASGCSSSSGPPTDAGKTDGGVAGTGGTSTTTGGLGGTTAITGGAPVTGGTTTATAGVAGGTTATAMAAGTTTVTGGRGGTIIVTGGAGGTATATGGTGGSVARDAAADSPTDAPADGRAGNDSRTTTPDSATTSDTAMPTDAKSDSAVSDTPRPTDSASATDTGSATETGSTAFANPAPGSKFFIGANFWNESWEPASDFFANSVSWATTTNPWNPTLFTDLAPYAHVLRFMDWNRTNDQVAGTWSARAQPNVAPGTRGVAYEWQIDLCNRAHTDYWINVPTLADDNHVTQLAKLVQQKLDANLRIYIEYSNEVWNGGFPQGPYAQSQGVAMNIMGTNQSYKGWAWYVYRAVQVFQGFEAVFGKDSPRLVKVLSGQAGYTGGASNPAPVCAWHLQVLADKTVNPQGETINAYAIAPYFGGTSTAALASDIPSEATPVQNHVTCLKGTGIPLISYEGGQDSYAATSCTAVATDPAMASLYVTYLNSMMSAGLSGPFMQYTHVGNCWGLKMATGDSNANAPKYQGVLNWLAAHP
jgi:hypothetical protein